MTKLTPERLADFYRDSREQGIGHDEIANLLGVQRDSLTRRLGRHGIALIPEPLLKDECGYLGKYRDGCRCDACRAANAEFTASTRARRLPRRESAQFNHGRSGYVNWGCRCDVCSAAHSDSLRRRRRERMRNLDKAPHGTAAGYSGWGCRCEPCRTAAAIDRANRRRKLRAASGDPGPERSTPK